MAGHSKWANIRHRKSRQDQKKAKVFTRLIREITVAARMGGGDPDANPRLRAAIDEALGANMPKDTVERATKRGAGELEGENLEEVRYEGYGPSGVAIIVDCMTDNRNRTVSEVRHAFSKAGGNLGTDGSVAYIFTHCGVLSFDEGDEDAIMEAAIDAGAEDVLAHDDGSIEVVTTMEDFLVVRAKLTDQGLAPGSAELTMRPGTTSEFEDADEAQKVLRLLETLDDLDDVQQVYSNAVFSDAVLSDL